jgi:hypothetical protein
MGRAENDVRLEQLLEMIDAENVLRTLLCKIMSSVEADTFLDYLEDEYPDAFGNYEEDEK